MIIDQTKVVLPKWIFKKAKSEKHLQQLVAEYMVRYPYYEFLYEQDGFAVCIRDERRH